MTTTHPTKPTKFKCTQPGCEKEYNDKAHLGIHLRTAHGIAGKSHNATKTRQKRDAERLERVKTAAADQATKRKYTKRSTTLATLPQEANGHISHISNGQAQAPTRKNQTEAALAIGLGRFQELSKNMAFEFDLGARTFAAQLAELIYASTLR
jgi:hypothetical protein